MKVNMGNIYAVLEFLEAAGVKEEGLELKQFSNGKWLLEKKEEKNNGALTCKVSVDLDSKQNHVLVKEEVEHEFNRKPLSILDTTNYSSNVLNMQRVTDFQVQGNQLNVVSATIEQSGKKDTLGNGNLVIVQFNSVFDFRDTRKTVLAGSTPIFANKTYSVADGYNVGSGLSEVGETSKGAIEKVK